MIIEVEKLDPEGVFLVGDDPLNMLADGPIPSVKEAGLVHYELFVQLVGSELLVQGAISLPLKLECNRCADFFSTSVRISSFLRTYPVSRETDHVDLSGDMREELMVEIPTYPRCKEDCRGLCLKCGKNLNREKCSCRKGSTDIRLGVLDGLDLK